MTEKTISGSHASPSPAQGADLPQRRESHTSKPPSNSPQPSQGVERNSKIPSTLSASLAPFRPAATPPPSSPRGSYKSMNGKAGFILRGDSEIQNFAERESQRGKPLIIVSLDSTYAIDKSQRDSTWTSGFQYKIITQRETKLASRYPDLTQIYYEKSLPIQIFYGAKNQRNISFLSSDLKKCDPDGTLIDSILGINSATGLKAAEAEGIGLIAACIGLNYIPSSSPLEGEKLLQHIPAHARRECLRHGLLFSCGLGSKPFVDEFFRLGANPNVASDEDGSMPLEIAIDQENLELARTILAHGANADIELSSGMTCRLLAERLGSSEWSTLFERTEKK